VVTFDQIENWLRVAGFQVISDDDEISSYKKRQPKCLHLLKVDVPNTELSFRVHFENKEDSFDIRTARYFSQKDEINFSNLSVTRQQKFYIDMKKVAYPYGINVLVYPNEYEMHFIKTFFMEGLNKQYFFDAVFDFIHASELVITAYKELSGPDSVVDPRDLT
jgi:hypothetical protein